MGTFKTILDAAMCVLWIATYTLVLIGTIKYKYPLISPMAQAVIAPFETAVLICYVFIARQRFDYVLAAYLYWTIVEITIITVILKSGAINKKYIFPYISFMVMLTAAMVYAVALKGQMFLFSYVNTFIGETIWYVHIKKEDYPTKPIVLSLFITKWIADVFAAIVYLGNGSWIVDLMVILLPLLDSLFIFDYVKKRKNTVKIGSE